MSSLLSQPFRQGYEAMYSWTELINRINVFPVSDGDTGTNLAISLAPLINIEKNREETIIQLQSCATGNSGNIAAAFFVPFCQVRCKSELARQCALANTEAWQAVDNPKKGTMLDVFAQLSCNLQKQQTIPAPEKIMAPVAEVIKQGVERIHQLEKAGVIDAGALAMYIFFDAFYHCLEQKEYKSSPVFTVFAGLLEPKYIPPQSDNKQSCINLTIKEPQKDIRERITALSKSVVITHDKELFRIHLHTENPEQLKKQAESMGEIISWREEEIKERENSPAKNKKNKERIHIISDRTASLPEEVLGRENISLIDANVICNQIVRPESLWNREEVYSLLRKKDKVSTAQSSNLIRQSILQQSCRQNKKVIYLCTGSAYTGNYAFARQWQKEHDRGNKLAVIDSGASSGKLGLMLLLLSRFLQAESNWDKVSRFAQELPNKCYEYIFINELSYLVAGGRVSKLKGFAGDLLGLKPVISPKKTGVKKITSVKNRQQQVELALRKINELKDKELVILLQYSDNKDEVQKEIKPLIKETLPDAELITAPLSLSSAIHMGPETWAMAWAEK